MNNHQHQEWEIASLMNKTEWYSNGKGPYHEWQICCLSQTALRKIKNNPQANRVLSLRSKIAAGWGDHCMGLAARFAKIYPVSTNFLSAHPLILESTFLGGWVTHFHRIYQHKAIHTLLPVMMNRKDGNFANQKLLLCRKSDNEENDHKEFVRLEKGGVVIEDRKRIAMWTALEDNKLAIYTMEHHVPFVFDFEEGNECQANSQTWKIHINQ